MAPVVAAAGQELGAAAGRRGAGSDRACERLAPGRAPAAARAAPQSARAPAVPSEPRLCCRLKPVT